MNIRHIRLFVFGVAVSMLVLLSACEDEDSSSNEVKTLTPSRADARIAANSIADQTSSSDSRSDANQDEESQGLWRVISDMPPFESNTNWYLSPPPPPVDANLFLETNGTYVADGNVFTNCDDLGFYLLFRESGEWLLVTNCGTLSFP